MNNPAGVGRGGIQQQPPVMNRLNPLWYCAKIITSIALSALLSLVSLLALPFPFSLVGAGVASFALLSWGFRNRENPVVRQQANYPANYQVPLAPVYPQQQPIVYAAPPAPIYVAPQQPPAWNWRRLVEWMQPANRGVPVVDPRRREEVGDEHVNVLVRPQQPARQVVYNQPDRNAQNVYQAGGPVADHLRPREIAGERNAHVFAPLQQPMRHPGYNQAPPQHMGHNAQNVYQAGVHGGRGNGGFAAPIHHAPPPLNQAREPVAHRQ